MNIHPTATRLTWTRIPGVLDENNIFTETEAGPKAAGSGRNARRGTRTLPGGHNYA